MCGVENWQDSVISANAYGGPAFNGWPVTVFILAILALYFARLVLIPLALAITMTFILAPAVAWLQKIHLGRTLATLIVITVAIGLTGFTGSIVFNQFLSVIDELPKYKENIVEKAAALRTPMQGTLRRAADTVSELSKEIAKAPPPAPDQRPPKTPTPVQIVPPPDGLYYLAHAAHTGGGAARDRRGRADLHGLHAHQTRGPAEPAVPAGRPGANQHDDPGS